MREAIIIRGWGSVSALGFSEELPSSLHPSFVNRDFGATGEMVAVAALPPAAEEQLQALRHEPDLRSLDRAALLGILAARRARQQAGWQEAGEEGSTGVAIGSSRGATGRLETDHAQFLASGQTAPSTSPLTTPGHLASAVARDLAGTVGAVIGQSSTCSSAFQALGTAVAWLRAGLADRFLAGGTEAPLTAFTVAQMRAVGIYSALDAADYPCRPLQHSASPINTFVLGEGAAIFALERGRAISGDLVLAAVGFGFERAASKTGITSDGQHFQQAMRQALKLAGRSLPEIDTVILHAPGTVAGDAAELAALHAVFGPSLPELLSNKWLLGHTLGASAALSLAFACRLLRHPTRALPLLPYPNRFAAESSPVRPRRRILVNAAGFGGSAASVLVEVA